MSSLQISDICPNYNGCTMTQTNSAILERLRRMIAESKATNVGLAARRLTGQDEILIDPDLAFHPASTMKICVMMESFRRARSGELPLDGTITVQNEFHSIVDGSSFSLDPADDSERALYDCIGQSFTRRELIRRMIVVSSNLATNLLLEELHCEPVTALMRELGTQDLTVIRGLEDKQAFRRGINNSATARSYMQVLLKLAMREVVSPQDSDEMLQILRQQEFNEMIPAELPVGTQVAHKTGWTADYFHDVGIVYPAHGEPFVLCILTKGYAENDEIAAHAFVASLAKAIYEHWNPPA